MKIGLVCAAALTVTLASLGTAYAQAPSGHAGASAGAAAATAGAARPGPSPAGPASKPAAVTTQTADYRDQDVEGNQVVTFSGDSLPGDVNDPYFGVIRPLEHVLRAQLLRPRLNFVPELLKSVENL